LLELRLLLLVVLELCILLGHPIWRLVGGPGLPLSCSNNYWLLVIFGGVVSSGI
jgi:hypothetical protein